MDWLGGDINKPGRGSAFGANPLGEVMPATPSEGALFYSKVLAGRRLPAWLDTAGEDYAIQPHLGRNRVAQWQAEAGATALDRTGIDAVVTGTGTARTPATTNYFTAARRVGFVTAATAGASAGVRSAVPQWWRGTGLGLGGFTMMCRFGINSALTAQRCFVGLLGSGAVIGAVNPSTLTNCIGVGYDSADTSFSIIRNDTTSGAVKTALGTNFPAITSSTDVYEVCLYCPAGGATVGVRLDRISTTSTLANGDATRPNYVSEMVFNTRLPATTVLLAPQVWINNGTLLTTAAIDILSMYIESDN